MCHVAMFFWWADPYALVSLCYPCFLSAHSSELDLNKEKFFVVQWFLFLSMSALWNQNPLAEPKSIFLKYKAPNQRLYSMLPKPVWLLCTRVMTNCGLWPKSTIPFTWEITCIVDKIIRSGNLYHRLFFQLIPKVWT